MERPGYGSKCAADAVPGARPRAPAVREFWARSKAGVPQFILLRGDPGIGKSRFVEEVRSEIFDDETEVLVARCTPIAANTAFHPILELISRRLGFASATPEMRAASIARRMEDLGFVPVETVPLIASLFSLPLDPAKWPASNLTPAVARRLTMGIFLDWVHVATAVQSAALHHRETPLGRPIDDRIAGPSHPFAAKRPSVGAFHCTARIQADLGFGGRRHAN